MRTLDAQLHLHQRAPRPTTATSGGRASPTSRRPTSSTGRARTGRPSRDTPAAHPNARFTAPAVAVPVDRPRVGGPGRRADLGHPLRRPPGHQRPAGDRGLRLAARRVPRLDHVARRRPPPPPAPSARCASTPSPCCPFCGYNMGDYFAHWLEIGEATDADKLPEALLGQLVPQGRRRHVPVARLRREQPGAQVGHRAGRRAPARPSTPPSAACPTVDGARHRRPRHRPTPPWPSCSRSTPRPGGARSR